MNAKDIAREIELKGLPVFVWGYWTQTTQYAAEALEKIGVDITGYIKIDNTATEPKVNGRVISPAELASEYSEYVLIKGYIEHYYFPDDYFFQRFPACKAVYEVTDTHEILGFVEPYDDDFLIRNKDELSKIKEVLADDKSVEALEAFLEMKTSGNADAAKKCVEKKQYFFDASWKLSEQEVFFDCGAFIGDSASAFIESCGGMYKGIIACEPDKQNYIVLRDYLEEQRHGDVVALNYATGGSNCMVSFKEEGTSASRIIENGDVLIEQRTIDSIVIEIGMVPTIIKMDIEGMEVETLKGAEKTIRESRPILMICAYHKKNDLFDIFQFVNSIVDNYCWFFRCHTPITVEGVYYIVPKERVKLQ